MAYTGRRRPTRDACCPAFIALCHSRKRLKATESMRRLRHTVAHDMKAVPSASNSQCSFSRNKFRRRAVFASRLCWKHRILFSESRKKQVIVRRSRARRIVLRRHEEVRRQRAVFVLCEQRPRFVEWYHCRHRISASQARWYRRYRSVIGYGIFRGSTDNFER